MLLEIVHFLHILAGVTWAGGTVFFAFVVEPALLKLGPAVARDLLAKARPHAGALMGGSGFLLLATGIGRPFLGGGITSWRDLFEPYGLLVLAALAVVVLVTILGHRHRATLMRMLEAAETQQNLRMAQLRQMVVTGTGISATILIMTILGLGQY